MKKYSKIWGMLFILLGITGLFFLFYQVLSFEKYATDNIDFYYPVHTRNNVSGWNFFAYFTYLSNIFVDIYLILLGLSFFNIKGLDKVVNNSYIQGCVTVNICITGIVYAVLLAPHLEPYPRNDPMFIANVINAYNHIVMPIFMVVLWFCFYKGQMLKKRFILITLLFPTLYFAFSLIRGSIMQPNWYPYPFINPRFLWGSIYGDVEFEIAKGYGMFFVFLLGITLLFISIAIVLRVFRNKQLIKK